MDIVTVKARSKSSQKRLMQERRHTTEVRFDQLPSHTLSELERDSLKSLSQEDLSPRGEHYQHPVADYPQLLAPGGGGGGADSSYLLNGKFYKPSFKNSWGNICPSHPHPLSNSSDFNFQGSQGDLYQELTEHAQFPGGGGALGAPAPDHQYQLSYDLAMDNMLTPFAHPQQPNVASSLGSPKNKSMQKSHVSHVVEEMVTTETTYVHDLSSVIEGYVMPLQMRTTILPYDSAQLDSLFGNIVQIRDFHRAFLERLAGICASNINDLGQCFLDRADGFKDIYTNYCNNYPNSIRVLADLSKQSDISRFLKTCQQRLGHLLPLGAYLLKPVQRVLKYSLLLTQVVKATPDIPQIQAATVKMAEVAAHINAMKRKYDTAVHVQELQSLVRGNENLDLTKFGDLVLEDYFKYSSGRSTSSAFRGRTERYVFLFQKLYLVTKKEEVGYQYKMHVEMKDLQLTERIEKEPTAFQIRQVSSGRSTTFLARTSQQKSEWVQKIKFLLVESIPHLPDRARELIMRGFEVPRDPSPNREHHRRVTEPSLDDIVHHKSNSLGRNFSPQGTSSSHNTSPPKSHGVRGRHNSTPTGKLLQSSLTGLLVASIHQPLSPRSESPYESMLEHGSSFLPSPEQRDSGYSDTVSGDPHRRAEGEGLREELPVTPEKSRTRKLFSLEPLRATPELDHTPSHTPGLLHSPVGTPPFRRSPVPQHHDTENPADHMTRRNNGTEHVISAPVLECAAASLSQSKNHTEDVRYDSSAHYDNRDLLSGYPPEDATEHAQCDPPVTEEEETLFNELMDSFGDRPNIFVKKTSSTDLDWGDPSLRSVLSPEGMQQLKEEASPPTPRSDQSADLSGDSSPPRHNKTGGSVDENSTPRASPYTSPSTIRRWSVSKRRSYDISDPEDSTPKASPFIHRHQSANAHFVVPPPHPVSGEEVPFVEPILDPPTPFRTPFPVESVRPCPDEDSELGVDPSWADQDTSGNQDTSGDQDTLLCSDQDIVSWNDQDDQHINQDILPPTYQDTSPPSNRDTISYSDQDNYQDTLQSSDSDLQLPVFESPLRSHPTAKSKTLPPNMSFEDIRVFMAIDKVKSMSTNSVQRSRSFGNRAKIVHKRAGSLSTDNSPLPSPIFTKKGRGKEPRHSTSSPSIRHQHGTTTPRGSPAPSVAMVGLISTTRTTPELQDIPLIHVNPNLRQVGDTGDTMLPPTAGFEDATTERSSSRASSTSREVGTNERESVEREDRSLLSFLRLKSRKGSRSATPGDLTMDERKQDSSRESSPGPAATPMTTPTTTMSLATPTTAQPTTSESSPNDMMSFEDALDTYDRYATKTGKTARSARREAVEDPNTASPDVKKKKSKKKSKKKRHGHTVANIDADTMREVKRMTEDGEERRRKASDNSKVHQLAREYSQRIKDRSKGIARYSTVVEEVVAPVLYPVKPVWLTDLQERRQQSTAPAERHNSLEDILSRGTDEDTSSTSASSVSIGDDVPANGKSHTIGGGKNHGLLFEGAVFQEQAGEEEGQKKQRFKGWVRSLAARFGKKEGTTL